MAGENNEAYNKAEILVSILQLSIICIHSILELFLLMCHHSYIVWWNSTNLNTIDHFIATSTKKKTPKLNEGRKHSSETEALKTWFKKLGKKLI